MDNVYKSNAEPHPAVVKYAIVAVGVCVCVGWVGKAAWDRTVDWLRSERRE